MNPGKQKPPRSLKSKALQLLAQREQSRVELRRKLMAHALQLAEAAAEGDIDSDGGGGGGGGDCKPSLSPDVCDRPAVGTAPERTASRRRVRTSQACVEAPAAVGGRNSARAGAQVRSGGATGQVDEVLAWLDAHGFASDERFTESRINARSSRYGDLRIRHELKQHGVALDAAAARALGETEASRGWAVWERRFGAPPASPSDAAKQARFLATRGFSSDTVRQVLRRARAMEVDNPMVPAPD